MTQKRFVLFYLLLIGLLVACGGGAEEPAAEPETVIVEPTAVSVEEPAAETADSNLRTFTVVPGESTATFIVSEEFLSQALSKLGINAGNQEVEGSTDQVEGELVLNTENPNLLESGTFTVNVASLKTDQDRRDTWLEDNALETSRFPVATFVATGATGLPSELVEGQEVNFQLAGTLTVRDVVNNVTFDVTAVLNGDTINGVATLPLRMTDFNIEPPNFIDTLTVADDFTIRVNLVARE